MLRYRRWSLAHQQSASWPPWRNCECCGCPTSGQLLQEIRTIARVPEGCRCGWVLIDELRSRRNITFLTRSVSSTVCTHLCNGQTRTVRCAAIEAQRQRDARMQRHADAEAPIDILHECTCSLDLSCRERLQCREQPRWKKRFHSSQLWGVTGRIRSLRFALLA